MAGASATDLSPDKEVRDLIAYAVTLGYRAYRTNGGHIGFAHPLIDRPIFGPSTPSEYRSLKNTRAKLKREAERAEEEWRTHVQPKRAGEDQWSVDCPSCLKDGKRKGFFSPEALTQHFIDEHTPSIEELRSTEPKHEQEREVSDNVVKIQHKQEGRVTWEDVVAWLKETKEPGDRVTRQEVLKNFEDREGAAGAVETLRSRADRENDWLDRLVPNTEWSQGVYAWAPANWDPSTGEEIEWDDEEESKVSGNGDSGSRAREVVLSSEMKRPKTKGKMYEVINEFVDGQLLLRDDEGALYTAQVRPLQ